MPILGPFNPAQLASAAQRLASAARRRLRPDHRAIAVRRVKFAPQHMGRLYLYAVVAPSRFAPRAFDDGQVRRARAFALDAFPGVFEDQPTSAQDGVTLFAVEVEDGFHERALYIHRTGLVELLWALDLEEPEGSEDELLLDTAEMVAVLTQLASAVARRPYAELSKAGRGQRRFARVDWWFHLATGVAGPNGPRSWTGLKFAGSEPPRAQHQYPAAPIDGYGWPRLRNRRRKKSPEDLVTAFLAELLTANGYYEFSAAVEETVAQAMPRRGSPRSRSTDAPPQRESPQAVSNADALRALLGHCQKLVDSVTTVVQGWKDLGGRPFGEDPADVLIQTFFARSTRTYEAVVQHLGNRGFGEQGAMLNRSLFEDMVDARWVTLNPELAAQRLHLHYRYSEKLRFEVAARFPEYFGETLKDKGQLDPPMADDEERESVKLFGAFGHRSWTGIGIHQRFQAVLATWDEEHSRRQVEFIFAWLQRQNNETLHPSAHSLITLGGPKSAEDGPHFRLGSTEHLLADVLFFAFWTYAQTVRLLCERFGLDAQQRLRIEVVDPGLKAFVDATGSC